MIVDNPSLESDILWSLTEDAPQPMFIYRTLPLEVQYVNKAFSQKWGYLLSTDRPPSQRIDQLAHPKERSAFREYLQSDVSPPPEPRAPVFRLRNIDSFCNYSLHRQVIPWKNEGTAVACYLSHRTSDRMNQAWSEEQDIRQEIAAGMQDYLHYLEKLTEHASAVGRESKNVNRSFELIDRVCQQLSVLVEYWVAGVKTEKGFPKLHKEKVNLVEEITKSLDILMPLLQNKNLKVQIKTSGSQICATIDRIAFRLIIQNLLSRAIRHTKKGIITVSLKSYPQEVLVQVDDTGPGIRPELQPYIFRKRSSALASSTRLDDSSRLGTYLVKQLVMAHRGEVWFESQRGVGTTFFVRLPS